VRTRGTLAKVLYSAGNISAALPSQFFSTFVIFFYVDTLKLPPTLVGTGMVLYGIWNAINDPLFGQLSDQTRTRWGRRIPYILFGTLPLALAFALVWVPPFRMPGAQWPLFSWFMATIFLFDGLYTLVILNWTALYPEMYPSAAERASVSALRQFLGIIGMIIGTALPPVLISAVGWGGTGAIFAVLTALFLGLSLLGAHERPEAAEQQGLKLIPALRQTFGNRSFLTFLGASLFIQFTFVTLTSVIPFFAKYVLRATSFQTTVLLGSIFIVSLPLVYVWSRLTVRWGARKAMIVAASLYGLGLTPFLFVNSFLGGVLTTLLLAVGLSGLMILFDILIAEVVDEDELRTGIRREGMHFGVNGFMVRLGISLQAIIVSQVLSRTGYSADLAVQPASAIAGLRALVTVVPWIALVIAIVSIYFYPLHGARLAEVQRRVAAKHAGAGVQAD